MMGTNQQGHPNRQIYIGFDPNTLDSAAPYVANGLLSIASYVYNSGTGQWVPATPQLSETQFSYINWIATANGTGYVTNDYLQQVDEYNINVTPAQYLGTTWRNITQGTTLSSAPTAGTYIPVSSIISTVSVNNFPAVQAISATALPLPTGAATSANQATEISYLTSIAASVAGLGGGQNTVLSGQKKIATTGTAVQLGSGALVNGVIITANINNAAPISIGPVGVNNTQDGTGNGYILNPGTSIAYSATNLSPIYINGTAGDFVSYSGN